MCARPRLPRRCCMNSWRRPMLPAQVLLDGTAPRWRLTKFAFLHPETSFQPISGGDLGIWLVLRYFLCMSALASKYEFLVDTYRTEIVKVLSVWSEFDDFDLTVRPHATDKRGRSPREQMIHQCVSENLWFSRMLGISVTDSPLPKKETRLEFMRTYARDASRRLEHLAAKDDG